MTTLNSSDYETETSVCINDDMIFLKDEKVCIN